MSRRSRKKKIENTPYPEKIAYVRERVEKRETSKLIELLHSDSWVLREEAAKGLVKIGREAQPQILKILKDGYWYEKIQALYILGEWREKGNVREILPLIRDENMRIRDEASIAIYKIILAYNFIPDDVKEEDLLMIIEILKENKKDNYANKLREFIKKK